MCTAQSLKFSSFLLSTTSACDTLTCVRTIASYDKLMQPNFDPFMQHCFYCSLFFGEHIKSHLNILCTKSSETC